MFKDLRDKKRGVSPLLLVFIVVAMGVFMQTGTAAVKVGPAIGNKAPNFILNDLKNKKVELYKVIKENKVTLINFWGIWCPYCLQEIPGFVKFYSQYHKRQVEILAVNSGDDPQALPYFIWEQKMTFPVLIDKNDEACKIFQVNGFPTTFIIDRHGKIRDIINGRTNQTTLTAKVKVLLKEKK